jgi:sugar phosphate isomerase/epimerase
MWKKIGVVASALGEDFRAAVRDARSCGFAGVQLEARMGELDLLSLSQSGKREVRAILRAGEIELVGLRVDLGSKGMTDVDAGLDWIEKMLLAAEGLQCGLVCVEIGPMPANEEAWVELGRRADRHGVMVALRSELAGFEIIEGVIRKSGCPWIGIDFDPVGMLKDQWSEGEIFSRVGGLIRHVRGRDAILGSEKRTKGAVMGKGSVEWGKLLGELDEAGFGGWITIDPSELSNRRAAAIAGLGEIQNSKFKI